MYRLPNVPALQPTALDTPGVRPAVAAAPAAALSQLAESIAGVGEEFHHTALLVQHQENARVESEKRNQLALDYAQLQFDLQADPDPTSRFKKTREFLDGYKGKMDDGNLPPI
ncbi:MAG: hypothetical protein WCS42_20210, partial [Verrucomicrobiota bacterium]